MGEMIANPPGDGGGGSDSDSDDGEPKGMKERATFAPITAAPVTPSPITPSPVTPSPVTQRPSSTPSFKPSFAPSTPAPSSTPSSTPSTPTPSFEPTLVLSDTPSSSPSVESSSSPTTAQSSIPSTSVPSTAPSTPTPSSTPSTPSPSSTPSTSAPTTSSPSSNPTLVASAGPSSTPTTIISSAPSSTPSTPAPSSFPPSHEPSSKPSFVPSSVPSIVPSKVPSVGPSFVPSPIPTPAPTTPAPTTEAPLAPIPPSPGFPACNICGIEGSRVTLPNVILNITGADPVTCANFEIAGALGFIEETFCPLVSALTDPCECSTVNVTQAPSSITGAPITAAPIAPSPMPVSASPSKAPAPIPPSPGFPACSICGVGRHVTLPNVILNITGVDPVTCGTFEIAGNMGFIEEAFCPAIPTIAAPCGCAVFNATFAPVNSTAAPVFSTAAPTTAPPVLSTEAPITMTQAPGTEPPMSSSLAPVTAEPATPTQAPLTAEPSIALQPIPPSPGFPACSICGVGNRVTLPNVFLDISDQEPVACGVLERAGDNGFIDATFCPAIPFLTAPCGCVAVNTTSAPVTAAPVVGASTPAPQVPTPPSPGFPSCNVCGVEGSRVTLPNAILDITGEAPVSCGNFQIAGDEGFIQAMFCPIAQALSGPCGCSSGQQRSLYSPVTASPALLLAAPVTDPPGTVPQPDVPVAPPTTNTPVVASPLTDAPVVAPVTNAPVGPPPTATPVVTLAPAPVLPPIPPIPPNPGYPRCNVCGKGLRVTAPDAVLSIPGQDPMTCREFELAGDFGFVESMYCPFMSTVAAPCGCAAPASINT